MIQLNPYTLTMTFCFPKYKNRKIRVDLATHAGRGNERGGFNDRAGGGGRYNNRDNDDDDRTAGDWRSGPPPPPR